MVISTTCVTVLLLGGESLSASGASTSSSVLTGVNLQQVVSAAEAARDTALATASSLATASGEPVAVAGLTTPTTQTLAMPDGTMQYEVSTQPVRVERGDEWVPVDTTLSQVEGWFEPVASASPVRFSAGGGNELAQVQTASGEWITELWPYGDLPTPAVDGDTATYAEVLPGVDLKMIATATGQTSIYVVKDEIAAQSKTLDDLHVVIEGAELAQKSDGTVEAETSAGSQVVAGQPMWWDSSEGGSYRDSGDAPALPVTHEVDPDRVAFDVGASVAAEQERIDDEVTYPIFIDPDWSTGQNASWYTDKAFPNQPYLNVNPLRTGISAPYHSDMFFQFPISRLSGTIVSRAVLNTTMVSVLFCSPDPIEVRTYGPTPDPGFTWNQQFAVGTSWGGVMQSQNPGNCGSPATPVGWEVTSGVQAYANSSTVRLGITAPGSRSRRHFSPAASLIVSYNTRPNTPTSPVFTSPSRTCGTAANPTMIGQKNVTVRVNQTDPDPGNVDTNFFLARTSNLNAPIQSKAGGFGAQGLKSAQFTELLDGAYAWRARGSDWVHDGAAFSAWCYFTIDTVKPALPVVTAPAGTAFAVGKGISVSVTGAADVAGYVYWITPGQLTSPAPAVPVGGTVSVTSALPNCSTAFSANVRWACANGASPSTLTVAPTDSLSTLWVSAYDKAGNQSAARGFPLYLDGNTNTPAASANLDAGHAWQTTMMGSPLPNTIPDSNPWAGANALDLFIPENSSTTSTDLPDPPLESPVISTAGGTAEEVHTLSAPVNAMNSFTFSTWVKVGYIPTATQKIAMQGGGATGSIQLQLAPGGKYAFCVGDLSVSSSSTSQSSNCATGGAVAVGQWQMVTGIWDPANKQLRLLVGNSINPVAVNSHVVGTGDRSANGPLIFGPAPMTGRFEGLIANPVIVPGVIERTQLTRLAAFELPFTD
ncbi:LamG domain-containing protein [Microbacterium galbinum]|uniref:LamG domain-containing protein n=1 Tax=Microbacterium galbinum TaxID=2851646 RepID=UPI001FFD6CF0|nr:LamG domain-containing protein [Microbacterium galbinum]MCK2030446.1 LamG domain-containing protein [Microbacterium galbinum]